MAYYYSRDTGTCRLMTMIVDPDGDSQYQFEYFSPLSLKYTVKQQK